MRLASSVRGHHAAETLRAFRLGRTEPGGLTVFFAMRFQFLDISSHFLACSHAGWHRQAATPKFFSLADNPWKTARKKADHPEKCLRPWKTAQKKRITLRKAPPLKDS